MQQGIKCKRTQLSINVTLRPFAWGLSHTGVLQIPTQYLSDKIKKVVQQANSELFFFVFELYSPPLLSKNSVNRGQLKNFYECNLQV